MANFALIGAAGFVAPRHMQAIARTGNRLAAALDLSDSVGVIDDYFPDSAFFTEFERFDRHIDKLRRMGGGEEIHYVSVCSPNYLHDAHIRFGLRSGADVICEKPLVLNPWNIDGLQEAEARSGRSVSTVLQLRLHPDIAALRERIAHESSAAAKHEVDLTYIAGRGRWYAYSWKGDDRKSGGIATNIGVHFFDMLHFVFGELQDSRVHLNEAERAAGFLEYERARVRWFLSIAIKDVPAELRSEGQRTYRSITVNGEEIEFSGGFADLHTRSYEEVLAGRGFRLSESRSAIEAVAAIRGSAPVMGASDQHPFVRSCVTK
jgi:UDP-N-acetyl-2-amino-2-deoxyglucuronate dehydrogenase